MINTSPFQRRQPKSFLTEENSIISDTNGVYFVKTEENWQEGNGSLFEATDTLSKLSSSDFNSYEMHNTKTPSSVEGKEIHREMMMCQTHRELPNCKTCLCLGYGDPKIKTAIEVTGQIPPRR